MKRILLIGVMIVICYPAICFSQVCTTEEGALGYRTWETFKARSMSGLTGKQISELVSVGEIMRLPKGSKLIKQEDSGWWQAVKARIPGSNIELWFEAKELDCR